MRIRSSTVDGHQFTRSRRGYDTAEVDAVMSRLADTLRDYEDLADDLESRVAAAETAARVSRTTSSRAPIDEREASHRYAAEIVQQAEAEVATRRAEITALLEAAREEAEDLRLEAERARAAIEDERAAAASDLATAHDEAAELRRTATETTATERAAATEEIARTLAAAEAKAVALLAAAVDEAKQIRRTAAADADELRRSRMEIAEAEIAERVAEVQRRSAQTGEDAERTLAALEEARRERDLLDARMTRLRSAVRAIEAQMSALAGATAKRAGDIARLIDLERHAVETSTDRTSTAVADDAAPEPPPVSETAPTRDQPAPRDLPADPSEREAARPFISGPPTSGFHAPDEHAPLAVADPSALMSADEDDQSIPPVGTHTYEQHPFADPDGSGRPPADRATVVPPAVLEEDAPEAHQDPYHTVYQRVGRNLRARLRFEGQDPTQRGR